MSWPIRLLDGEPVPGQAYDAGTAWRAVRTADGWEDPKTGRPLTIAPKHADVVPLIVVMPGGWGFCVHEQAYSGGQHYGPGWDVSGEPERLTVNPSINLGQTYHGWIRDGVVTDDCEGRRFDQRGRRGA